MSSRRIQELMKERNIPPLSIERLEPQVLSGVDDTRIPEEIREEIRNLRDVEEVAMFLLNSRRKTHDFRITLKSSDDFRKFIFYTCDC